MVQKNDLIEKILETELSMFMSVPSRYPSDCREHPDVFRLHRKAQFSPWSEETLQSYLDDLLKAREEGLNLMTLKYARMENLVGPLNSNPIIEKIIQMQMEAQREMHSLYPGIVGRGRPLEDERSGTTSFKTYLRGELETCSDRTLELLFRDLLKAKSKGQNWAKMLYDHLAGSLGHQSIEELEDKVLKKHNSR